MDFKEFRRSVSKAIFVKLNLFYLLNLSDFQLINILKQVQEYVSYAFTSAPAKFQAVS